MNPRLDYTDVAMHQRVRAAVIAGVENMDSDSSGRQNAANRERRVTVFLDDVGAVRNSNHTEVVGWIGKGLILTGIVYNYGVRLSVKRAGCLVIREGKLYKRSLAACKMSRGVHIRTLDLPSHVDCFCPDASRHDGDRTENRSRKPAKVVTTHDTTFLFDGSEQGRPAGTSSHDGRASVNRPAKQ